MRDTADYTFYLFNRIAPTLGQAGRIFYSEELGVRRVQLNAFTPPAGVRQRYQLAAWLALSAAQEAGLVQAALLTDGSPTCGSQFVYDGSFRGRRKAGAGSAADLLRAHGITVFSDGQIPQLLAWMAQREQDDDQCKRVYDPQESSDGYRVLVDRLWPRGIKKEALACDEWCKELTPSAELRKAFHGEAIDFAHFSQRYRQELDAHRETGLRLAALAQRQPLTLLYAAKNTEQNHARVLAAWLAALPVTI